MKRSPLALSAAFLVLSSSLASAVTVGYWRFEEGTAGGTASGAGSILDSSGNGNHGTASGLPIYSSSVPFNPVPVSAAANTLSLDFDGVNDEVTIAHSATLNTASAFTIEFSMRSSATPAGQDLLVDKSHGGPTDSTGWLFQTGVSNGIVQFGVGTNAATPGQFSLISSLSNLYDGLWHHLVGVYDGDRLEFFVDGTSQGFLTGVNYAANTDSIKIGNHYLHNRFFPGEIDELRISDTALTTSEFLALPEPSRALLLALGLTATLLRRRR